MKRLTNNQRGMLRWIADCGPDGYRPSCDDRQPPSNKLKDAAWALSKKGMVSFDERAPRFRLTEKGRIMLDVMGPEPIGAFARAAGRDPGFAPR